MEASPGNSCALVGRILCFKQVVPSRKNPLHLLSQTSIIGPCIHSAHKGKAMAETSVSLLERLRLQPDAASWQRLVDLYEPLIRGWLRRYAVSDNDADDLTQDVMAVVVRELPHFEHNQRHGAFRSWLRTITVHRLRAAWRGRKTRPEATGESDFLKVLDQLEDPASDLSRLWDR